MGPPWLIDDIDQALEVGHPCCLQVRCDERDCRSLPHDFVEQPVAEKQEVKCIDYAGLWAFGLAFGVMS